MDPALRRRLDLGLVLLAGIAASTAVVAGTVNDLWPTLIAIVAAVLLTGILLFVTSTPEWAREDGAEAGDAD
jgi:predicted acyltransferase